MYLYFLYQAGYTVNSDYKRTEKQLSRPAVVQQRQTAAAGHRTPSSHVRNIKVNKNYILKKRRKAITFNY